MTTAGKQPFHDTTDQGSPLAISAARMRALMRASRRFLRSFLARLSADSFTACDAQPGFYIFRTPAAAARLLGGQMIILSSTSHTSQQHY